MIWFYTYITIRCNGIRGVLVNVTESEHGVTSSIPGRLFAFIIALITLGKV